MWKFKKKQDEDVSQSIINLLFFLTPHSNECTFLALSTKNGHVMPLKFFYFSHDSYSLI